MKFAGDASHDADEEERLRRELEKREAKLGPDDPQVAVTLHELGLSVREAGRPGEAVPLFERALGIREDNLGPDDVQVAHTLHELAWSVREAGRPGQAEPFFQRALKIKEAKLGPDDPQVAATLRSLALSVRQAGRPASAVPLLERALKILEAKLGPDDSLVAKTLEELALSVLEAGRLADALPVLERAWKATFGPDDHKFAATLREMGTGVRKIGFRGEAQAKVLLKRALEIEEAKSGSDHSDVARTPGGMGVCAPEERRAGEAEERFSMRALEEAVQVVVQESATVQMVPTAVWARNILPFTDFPGMCQGLLVNRPLHNTIKGYLSDIVVGHVVGARTQPANPLPWTRCHNVSRIIHRFAKVAVFQRLTTFNRGQLAPE